MLTGGLSLASLLANVIVLLIAIPVHEFAHAWAAYRLGDMTARNQGRLTLNPLAHLDPLGSLMLVVSGFGWGKPTPVNPYNLRNGPKAGMALTSIAGPISNLIMAFLFSIPFRLNLVPAAWFSSSGVLPGAADILFAIIIINISLAIFNLIPVAPLDGFAVAIGLLPRQWALVWARTQAYGPLILLGLIFLGRLLPFSPLGIIMTPFINLFLRLFLGSAI
jgi:Zn-dependent protease